MKGKQTVGEKGGHVGVRLFVFSLCQSDSANEVSA